MSQRKKRMDRWKTGPKRNWQKNAKHWEYLIKVIRLLSSRELRKQELYLPQRQLLKRLQLKNQQLKKKHLWPKKFQLLKKPLQRKKLQQLKKPLQSKKLKQLKKPLQSKKLQQLKRHQQLKKRTAPWKTGPKRNWQKNARHWDCLIKVIRLLLLRELKKQELQRKRSLPQR